MKNKKVFVGLSGGVDSAVSAALLKQEGCEVTGVFIRIAIPRYPCPAAQDRIEAMRVAAHLDIPFFEVDLSREYEQEVFRPAIEEWRGGRTPNPDTLCNEKIKFGIFFDWCISKGADYVATGHYARLRDDELHISADSDKDQSYFLWAVPQEKLVRTIFPIGDLHKTEVRRLAEHFGLPNASRPDSQGLCFLGDISLDDLLQKEVGLVEGEVLNEQGEVVGRHEGAVRYTLGQRHGFELTAKTPDTLPHFVVAKDVVANTVTVSTSRTPRSKTKTRAVLERTNWIGSVEDGKCEARYRYRQKLIPAALVHQGDVAEVELAEPHAVPEGQSLVLYRESRCLGGGVIQNATLA